MERQNTCGSDEFSYVVRQHYDFIIQGGDSGDASSLYEAAEVDGATTASVFRITLPLLRPILIYVMITSLIGGLQMFDVPQVLTNATGDPMRSTMTLIMYLNKHLYSKNYGMAGALSVLMFLLTGVLSILASSDYCRKEKQVRRTKMKKEAEKTKGFSVRTRRTIAYIVLIFMVFLCILWFYILFINATRSHGENDKRIYARAKRASP